MMSDTPIDVALSFLSEDEATAKSVAEQLEDRVEVFYYADRQDELVSTDGEESFGRVFRDRSRIVVVFYREGWGETIMTRAERSAIKQRAAQEGYDFTIWVPTGKEKETPAYVDPQFLWFDFDRFGVAGLASVIESKLKASGKKVRPKTVWDELLSLGKKVDQSKNREVFKGSVEALSFVQTDRRRLDDLIEKGVQRLDAISPQVGFQFKIDGGISRVFSHPYCCAFQFDGIASNTALSTKLHINLFEDIAKRNRESQYRELSQKAILHPSIDDDGEKCWATESGQTMSLDEAVEWMLSSLGKLAFKRREDKIRKGLG